VTGALLETPPGSLQHSPGPTVGWEGQARPNPLGTSIIAPSALKVDEPPQYFPQQVSIKKAEPFISEHFQTGAPPGISI